MKILSFDPGYERLGIAVVEKGQPKNILLFSECFQTSKKDLFSDRLFSIGERVAYLIKQHKPDRVAIETLFFNTNQKTALRVAETRGVLLYVAKKSNLPVFEYTPLQIKIAVTGYGVAPKQQMDIMVRNLMVIEKSNMMDDEMDAIAVGITCIASNKKLSPRNVE